MKQYEWKTFLISKRRDFDYLGKLVKTLDKKGKYKYHDRVDIDCYEKSDTERLFSNIIVDDDDQKRTLIKCYLNDNKIIMQAENFMYDFPLCRLVL